MVNCPIFKLAAPYKGLAALQSITKRGGSNQFLLKVSHKLPQIRPWLFALMLSETHLKYCSREIHRRICNNRWADIKKERWKIRNPNMVFKAWSIISLEWFSCQTDMRFGGRIYQMFLFTACKWWNNSSSLHWSPGQPAVRQHKQTHTYTGVHDAKTWHLTDRKVLSSTKILSVQQWFSLVCCSFCVLWRHQQRRRRERRKSQMWNRNQGWKRKK